MTEVDGNQPCAECGDQLAGQRALRSLVEMVKGIEERVTALEERP